MKMVIKKVLRFWLEAFPSQFPLFLPFGSVHNDKGSRYVSFLEANGCNGPGGGVEATLLAQQTYP